MITLSPTIRKKWPTLFLKWRKSFVNKLNLLKRSSFLSHNILLDLYFKIILPFVSYALPIWGNFTNKDGFLAVVSLHCAGLLIGCGKKWEILQHFQGKLCGKTGPLCGKLCDFFNADLIRFFRSQRRKPIFLLSNEQLEYKKRIKVSKLNQLLPHFNYFNLKWLI